MVLALYLWQTIVKTIVTMMMLYSPESMAGHDKLGDGLMNYGDQVSDVSYKTTQVAKICELGIELWSTYNIADILDPYERMCNDLHPIVEELNAMMHNIGTQISIFPVLNKMCVLLGLPCLRYGYGRYFGTSKSIPTKGLSKTNAFLFGETFLPIASSCIELYQLNQQFKTGQFADAAASLRKYAETL